MRKTCQCRANELRIDPPNSRGSDAGDLRSDPATCVAATSMRGPGAADRPLEHVFPVTGIAAAERDADSLRVLYRQRGNAEATWAC